MKRNLIEKFINEKFINNNGKEYTSKNDCVLLQDNKVIFRYYSTNIATLSNNKLIIDLRYTTKSTLARINIILQGLNLNYSFHTKNYKTCINNVTTDKRFIKFDLRTSKYKMLDL